ncbi:Serine--pyruvate aminotransferase, mitochondrial [Liparis tanakae]|uniref:Alanine--glyoxylate aminotransferase n=1 Tax=Liparis tanakae TaxID=230148 RepID=A0A4Z2FJZ8_9TELE|nr:Serine--pyruvate aminotransferase, mitochondrial [Liparis tanakae]
MQRALFSRSALLAQQAAAALDSPLAARGAPLLQRLERSMSSVTIPPPACMLRPLEVPNRYLFGPGPSNVPPRILAAQGRPIIGHLHPEMYEIMNDIKRGIQYIFQTENNLTIAMSGSGHAAMECAVFNTVEPGESVLVAVNGIWGERVAEIAERMDIDILYSGSQKALNSPPGTAPISFNERACDKMFNRKTKPVSYLFDMTHLSNYWGCDGQPARVYHHTGPVSGFFALREGLAIVAEKGLEASWKKHKDVASYLYRGLEDLGLKLFIPDRDLRLPSVTTIAIPDGYNWRELLAYIMKHHQMEMTGGLGPSIGMVMRIGLMGYNCEETKADMALHALADALKNCKKSKV